MLIVRVVTVIAVIVRQDISGLLHMTLKLLNVWQKDYVRNQA